MKMNVGCSSAPVARGTRHLSFLTAINTFATVEHEPPRNSLLSASDLMSFLLAFMLNCCGGHLVFYMILK